MSLDIKATRRRIATGIHGDDWITEAEIRDAFSALEALVAEVERLREFQNNALHAGNDEVAEERAAVVAWLRAEIDAAMDMRMPQRAATLLACADAIEDGEHRREETK